MFSVKALKGLISLFKCERMEEFERSDEEKIYKGYQQYLRENQLVDFDDLLIYTHELLDSYPHIKAKYQTAFDHVLVDEFQDTDLIQYKILKILGDLHKNVFVVGDPDQSIYGFRGANYNNSKYFIRDFKAEEVILDKNYRSTNYILQAANKLIANNINRPSQKNLESDLGLGNPITYHTAQSDYQETFYVINEINKLIQQGYSYDDIAILYRNNALSRLFEDAMIKEGIPYIIYGGISFYERKEIKDALAYIRLINDHQQDFYFKRIVNVPKRSIGLKSIQVLEEKAQALGISMFDAIDYVDLRPQAKLSLLEFKKMIIETKEAFDGMEDLYQIMPVLMQKTGYMAMLKAEDTEIAEDRIDNLKELQSVFTRGDVYYEGTFYEKLNQQLDQIALYSDLDQDVTEENHVKLATYHQVKGLEFKAVFMAVLEEGIFPSDRALMSTYELEEERRVAYVGITRAQEKLYMTHSERRMVYGQIKLGYPSRFIKESRLSTPQKQPDIVYDQTSHILKTGDHVEHQVFGRGVVVSVDGEIAKIAFAMPHGIKQILESHPSIKKVKK
jgi:DNA helicase-2/ATP-dependent DNA helicase PcrA